MFSSLSAAVYPFTPFIMQAVTPEEGSSQTLWLFQTTPSPSSLTFPTFLWTLCQALCLLMEFPSNLINSEVFGTGLHLGLFCGQRIQEHRTLNPASCVC